MNCLDANTEVYMVLKKSSILPLYDETVVERGYDNVVYVEMLRRSCNVDEDQIMNSDEVWYVSG